MLEVEFEIDIDGDIYDVVFTPECLRENFSDFSKLKWILSEKSEGTMGVLCKLYQNDTWNKSKSLIDPNQLRLLPPMDD